MIRKIVINIFICVLTLSFFAEMASGADPATNRQLEEIIANEGNLLNTEMKKVEAIGAQLNEEEKRYLATNDLLKGAEKRWVTDSDNLVAEDRQHGNAVTTHNNNRCTNDSCAASYNANMNRLNTKSKQLTKDFDLLEYRRKGLVDRRNDLSNAVVDWTQRKKNNDANWRDLNAKLQRWANKVQEVENCKNIPGVGQFEKRLDGASEKAHRCLQRFFDGAQ